HPGDAGDAAVGVLASAVEPLQLAVAHARLEDEPVDAVPRELVGVAEVLEDAEDRPQDRLDLVAAVVRAEHRRAAEDDVVGEQGDGAVEIAALDRGAEGVHRSRAYMRTVAK